MANEMPERIVAMLDYDGEWWGRWADVDEEPLQTSAYHSATYVRADLCDAVKNGRRRGIKDAVTWLHRRADSMSDPHAREILNLAATELGRDKETGG